MHNKQQRRRFFSLSFGVVFATATGVSAPSHAVFINDQAAAELGFENIWDRHNRVPATVAITLDNGKFCTGTLIDSRTVLTAAHCLSSGNQIGQAVPRFEVRFGVDAAQPTDHDRTVGGALIHPNNDSDVFAASDIALLSLSEPVVGIEPVSLALDPGQLPPFGEVLLIAGYGRAGLPGQLNDIDMLRRVATMNYIGEGHLNDSPILLTLFRNPHDPASYDRFGLVEAGIDVPYLQGSAAPGDSGGPIYFYHEGRFWQIGTVIGGVEAPPPAYDPRVPDYGIINIFTPVAAFAEWLKSEMAYRTSYSLAGDTVWSDRAAWIDQLGRQEVPDNVAGSFEGRGALGRFYGVRIAKAGTVSLDMDATIDDLVIGGAAARLVIDEGRELTVNAGSLLVQGELHLSGQLETDRMVATGGILAGTGVLTSHHGILNLGAMFVSGEAGSTGGLQLHGDYTQGPHGMLVVPLKNGQAGTLLVSGVAELDGSLLLQTGTGIVDTEATYGIVSSGGLQGTFAAISSDLDFYSPIVSYSSNDAFAHYQRNLVTFADRARNNNEAEVAAALEGTVPQGDLYRGILNSRIGMTGSALASLSAQSYADTGTTLLRQSLRLGEGALTKRNRVTRHDDAFPTPHPDRMAGWAMVQGMSGHVQDGSRINHNATGIFGGFSSGDSGWHAGVLFGFSDATIDMIAPDAGVSAQTVHLGVEGSVDFHGFELSAGAMHSWHSVSMGRMLSVPGLPSSVGATFGARTLQVHGELAYPISIDGVGAVAPFTRMSWAQYHHDALTEHGSAAALSVARGRFAETNLGVGIRAEAVMYERDQLKLVGHGALAAYTRLGRTPSRVAASFENGPTFISSAVVGDAHRAALNAGAELRFGASTSLAIDYSGEFASGQSSHMFQLRLGAEF